MIYSDICGPITPRGYNRGKYFITFLDDWTKRSEVEIIESKSDAFPAFKRYQARNEHGETRISRLRTDYGGEYEDYAFDVYRADHGIMWEPTQPGNPEMNGAAERLGQTLFGMVSTIVEDSELDWDYWTELVLTANYLRNRSPVAGRTLTPFEAATGHKPRISHLRRIGTPGYATRRRPATGWKKGQDRANKGILVGYEGDHIYRLLMPDDSIARSAKVVWGLEKNGVLPETRPTAAEEESSSIYTPSSLPTLLSTSTVDSFSIDVDLNNLV